MHQKKYKSWFSGNITTDKIVLTFNESLEPEEDDFLRDSLKKNGDQAVNTTTGEVVEFQDGKISVVGVDFDFKDVYDRYQKAQRYKEYTFTKVIERTAKGDAYARMVFDYEWHFKKLDEALQAIPSGDFEARNRVLESEISSLKYITSLFRGKAESHREWVAQFPVVYDYAIQNFTPRPAPQPETPEEAPTEREVKEAITAIAPITDESGSV